MNDKIGGQLMYVLVIETDVNERFTMSMLLQRFGYTVCVAGNVQEGIEFLCVAPAVANAIFDAAGIRLRRLPIRPEAVLAALRAPKGSAQ